MDFTNDLSDLVKIVGGNQSKPINKFIYEIIYGLIKSKSIRLSEIGRSLQEECHLLYTEKRLHRNLYGKIDIEQIQHNYLKMLNIEDSVIAVDMCDIKKNYAKSMENLGGIWDGSKREIAWGYNMLQIEAVGSFEKRFCFPLSYSLYSSPPPVRDSANLLTLREVERISDYFPSKTWVFDRGFDRKNIINGLDELPLNFLIRQVGMRTVNGVTMKKLNMDLPYHCKGDYGFQTVSLIGIPKPKLLIKIKRKRNSMLLLSNKITQDPEEVKELIETYTLRWRIEESIRFIKSKEQGFNIEDIRLLKYEGLQKMMILVCLAYGFLCILKEQGKTQQEKPKHFLSVPRFDMYRVMQAIT